MQPLAAITRLARESQTKRPDPHLEHKCATRETGTSLAAKLYRLTSSIHTQQIGVHNSCNWRLKRRHWFYTDYLQFSLIEQV
jgi:hypothetical protein